MNKKGQSVLSEHVMIFFVVIAGLVAMTAFIQRSIQARIHDTRDYMIDGIANSSVCDANCIAATGGKITYEYEPYYQLQAADVEHTGAENQTQQQGSPNAIGAVYLQADNEATSSITTMVQLPAGCADGVNPKPAYCGGN